MSNFEDIQKALIYLILTKCPFELMHTVSTYPMKDEDANLKVYRDLKKKI